MAREAKRIDAAFTERKDDVVASLRDRYKSIARDIFDPNNIEQLLLPLSTELVGENAIEDAAAAGIDAVPDLEHVTKPTAGGITAIWAGKVRKYAREFPGRMAEAISQAAYDAEREASEKQLDDDARIALVMDAIETQAEAFRYEASLYSEPAWGAGNQGYGQTLEASGVMLDWICEPDSCDICAPMPEGNPYTLASLPMWPGDPHPNCRCHVTPDDVSWSNIFGDAAA